MSRGARVRLSVATYRRLLRVAFPPSFREGREGEMVEMFRDRVRGGGGTAPALVALWLRTLGDLSRHGTAEWMRVLLPDASLVQGLASDVRHATRSLAADRGFAAVALLTLALGVGANTAVFSVVDAVLLRPLPYPEPDRLVAVARWDGPTGERASFSYPDIADIGGAQSTLEALAPYTTQWVAAQTGQDDRGVKSALAPPALFDVLGIAPVTGRLYEEATPARGGKLAVVSARLAATLPGGLAPGASLRIDGVAHTVTGVMPAGFDFPDGTDLWVPLEADENRNGHWLDAVGRLAPESSVARAEDDLSRLVRELEVRFPGRYTHNAARVEPLRDRFTERARPMLLLLTGTVALVLLIACANLTGLSLIRAAGRRDDVRVRVALGASRGRIGRLAFVESGLLSMGGALFGLPAAAWSARALAGLAPAGLLGDSPVRIDLRVLAFTFAVMVAAALLSGLLAALAAARSASHSSGASRSRISHDVGTGLLRGTLVAGQVAVAVTLVSGAALLARSLVNLQRVPLGYEPGTVRAIPVTVRDTDGAEPTAREVGDFVARARARLASVPGVTASAAVYTPATGGASWRTRLHAEGAPVAPRPERYLGQFNATTPDYFETLRIPLLGGRTIHEGDGDGELVAVVSETLARTLWPGQEALGRRFTNGEPDRSPTWVTVVGVVGDVRNDGLGDAPLGEIYVPYGRISLPTVTFVVDGRWEIEDLATTVRAAIRGARPGMAVPQILPLSTWVDRGGRTRYGALLMSVFAALALLLATVGIYGLVAYAVAQRRRELGLRVALGARPAGLARIAAREGLRPTAIGIVVGVALTLATGRAIEGLLFGLDASDPVTVVSVPLLLLLVGAVACAVPALRATRVDPMAALRSD